MNAVCVLGNGQLGRMLRQAGEPLGISVFPVDVTTHLDRLPLENAIITAEIEQWSDTAVTQQLVQHPHFINRLVFPLIVDRQSQKALLDRLCLPTAPWCVLDNETDLAAAMAKLGTNIVVKKRKGGYDGRGQYRLTCGRNESLPAYVYGNAIAEACIPFSDEISLIGARNGTGQCVFYPLTHNYHETGILKVSIAAQPKWHKYQISAETMLTTLMEDINYIGVMAMECFVVGDKLLINELAPRVHNSGHWTQNGASISQFELHLRAILELPLLKPEVTQKSIMINLLGLRKDLAWLSVPNVHLHWYEKTVRTNRKMGHLNLAAPSWKRIETILMECSSLLPDSYAAALHWAKTNVVELAK